MALSHPTVDQRTSATYRIVIADDDVLRDFSETIVEAAGRSSECRRRHCATTSDYRVGRWRWSALSFGVPAWIVLDCVAP